MWHDNMPYNKIADRKGHHGWMKREGPYFIFPRGGTMFPRGASQYIEKLKQYISDTAKRSLLTALYMGCGIHTKRIYNLKSIVTDRSMTRYQQTLEQLHKL